MAEFLYYVGHPAVVAISIVFVINLMLNVLLTYFGYDPRLFGRGLVLRKRWALVIVVVFLLLAHIINGYIGKITELTPYPVERQDVIGVWRKGHGELQIKEDGTIIVRGELSNTFAKCSEDSRYYWSVDDSTLYVATEDGTQIAKLKIILFDGNYKILDKFRWDEDWELTSILDLGFSK